MKKLKIKMLKDFNVSDYKIIKKIGHGSFGQIFMVKDSINRKYALKKIIGSSEKEIKSLKLFPEKELWLVEVKYFYFKILNIKY